MLDWIGSLRMRESSPLRVRLSLSKTTQVAGWILFVVAGYATWLLFPFSKWLAIVPGIVTALGLLLATLRRELVFDREAGVLRVDQRAFGLANRAVVPLFHLRAVVVIARPSQQRMSLVSTKRYVAYVERRVGEAIYIDESHRCASLLKIAEAIAEVADVRLEYDAMSTKS